MDENKAMICKKFTSVLQSTRNGQNVVDLAYEELPSGDEVVSIAFKNGYVRRIDVTADSGTAMLFDIIRGLH